MSEQTNYGEMFDEPIQRTSSPEIQGTPSQEQESYTLRDRLSALRMLFNNLFAMGNPRYERSYKECLKQTKEKREKFPK